MRAGAEGAPVSEPPRRTVREPHEGLVVPAAASHEHVLVDRGVGPEGAEPGVVDEDVEAEVPAFGQGDGRGPGCSTARASDKSAAATGWDSRCRRRASVPRTPEIPGAPGVDDEC